MYRHKKR